MTCIATLWLGAGPLAWAQTFPTAEVIDGGYRDCSASRSGDRITASFTIDFLQAGGNLAGKDFLSRAMTVSVYDKTGKPLRPGYSRVSINGETDSISRVFDNFTVLFVISSYPRPAWTISRAYTANVRVDVVGVTVPDWPAIAVQAGNMGTDWTPVLARTGAVYIGANMQGCQIIDPTKPPPSPVTTEIKVTAPDWDLGELERGKETTRTFATDAQRLCFSYDPKYVDYDKYLISASNRNGVAGNRFQLVAKADPGERVPYTLSLAGGGAPVALPSANGLPLTLGKSGRTCLTPTFKASVGANIKGGDFSDVLTFTIVTTP